MCGFAGVVTWDERYRVSQETLAKMSAAVAHRGPDGEGVYFSPDAEITPARPQVALAHRRLAILDPDPRANQPFTDNAGRWLVFNGEIYNFRELRAELSALQPSYEWRTRCDTEVLLAAYGQWGEKCLDHLNGMFAFAVWDGPRRALFLARDRMGQKPLYIARPSCASPTPAIAFASELGSLKALPWFEHALHTTALTNYLRWGYLGSESTVYQQATKLAPGMWQRFECREVVSARYFQPNNTLPGPEHTALDARDTLITAVRRQLVSDVPLGCFLSGGIDSSVIVATAKLALPGGEPLSTFSIGFEDPRYDETPHARAVAAHFGTRHREFIVRPNAAADLVTLARAFGEPFGDSSALPAHYLARETRRHVKVALSGDGGDELFGGYDRYRAMSLDGWLQKIPAAARRALAGKWTNQLPSAHPKSVLAKMKRFLKSANLSPARRYAAYMRLFDDATIGELLITPPVMDRDNVEVQFDALAREYNVVQASLATDRITYLPGDLLTKVDRTSMLHALEVRSPFMDHDLVQFAAGLTTDQLLKGGPKRMLREAFARDLPPWLFKRKKMGFAVPIGDWFRGELRPMLQDHLFAADSFATKHFNRTVTQRLVNEHDSGRNDHSQRLYALLMLELWHRTESP